MTIESFPPTNKREKKTRYTSRIAAGMAAAALMLSGCGGSANEEKNESRDIYRDEYGTVTINLPDYNTDLTKGPVVTEDGTTKVCLYTGTLFEWHEMEFGADFIATPEAAECKGKAVKNPSMTPEEEITNTFPAETIEEYGDPRYAVRLCANIDPRLGVISDGGYPLGSVTVSYFRDLQQLPTIDPQTIRCP